MSKARMTMARLDAGERGSLTDWLRKVKWFLSGYPSYRTALFYDEHRDTITDWVEDESLSREEVIARFEALMPTATVAPARLTFTPGKTYAMGGRVDAPGSVSVPPGTTFQEPEKHWSERDVYPLMTRAEPAMRDELILAWADRDKALAIVAAVEELCDEPPKPTSGGDYWSRYSEGYNAAIESVRAALQAPSPSPTGGTRNE